MLDTKYTGVIRHAIEFYGTKPTIPAALRSFRGFMYNPDKARISFVVAAGTGFRNPAKIYSTDPDIQRFNSIFSAANKNINWKLVKTYDFADTTNPAPSQTPNYSPVTPAPKPNIPIVPTDKKDTELVVQEDSSIIPFFLAGAGLLLYLKSQRKKRKK